MNNHLIPSIRFLGIRFKARKQGEWRSIISTIPIVKVIIVQIFSWSEGLTNAFWLACDELLLWLGNVFAIAMRLEKEKDRRKVNAIENCIRSLRKLSFSNPFPLNIQVNAILECGALEQTLILENRNNAEILLVHKPLSWEIHNGIVSCHGWPDIHIWKPEVGCFDLFNSLITEEINREDVRILL